MSKPKRILLWLLVFIWMTTIFNFSAESGKVSDNRSLQMVQKFERVSKDLLDKSTTQSKAENSTDKSKSKIDSLFTKIKKKTALIEQILRKTAHVTEYFILALLVFVSLRQSRLNGIKRYLSVLAVCVLYASLDEIHQIFTPGRSPRVTDVLIDSIGISLALILCYVFGKYKRAKLFSPG